MPNIISEEERDKRIAVRKKGDKIKYIIFCIISAFAFSHVYPGLWESLTMCFIIYAVDHIWFDGKTVKFFKR